MTVRYALYYAPRPGEELAAAARQWLGRNPETGHGRPLPCLPGIKAERFAEITAEPRRYGFHATLKAPISLVEESAERDLLEAVGGFAARQRGFTGPSLKLTELSSFLALVPASPCAELQELADQCVVKFDRFRRPPDDADLERRRSAGLSPRQEDLLQQWGYPYVLDQWRFHMTLTGRLADPAERATLLSILRDRFENLLDRPLPVADLCVFRQTAPNRPFSVLARFRLGGGRRVRAAVWPAS